MTKMVLQNSEERIFFKEIALRKLDINMGKIEFSPYFISYIKINFSGIYIQWSVTQS